MGQRAEALAARYEQEIEGVIKTIEGLSDAQWAATCGEEQWTVAATAHHVGAQLPLEREYLTAAAAGTPMPQYTWDEINARNAEHAAKFSNVSKDETIKIIRENTSATADWVRGLSDEQLDRTSPLPLADGAEVSTQQLIEGGVLIDHAVSHHNSIRSVA
jgi:hypothetical protein